MGALRTPSTRRGDAAERWPFDNDLTRVICQFVPRRYAQCACHLSRVSRPAGGAAARRGSHRSPRRCRCRSPQPSKRCSGKPMQRRLCEINAPHRLRAAKERPASKASPRWVADAYRSRNTRRRGARAPSGGPAPRRRSVPPGQARRREAVELLEVDAFECPRCGARRAYVANATHGGSVDRGHILARCLECGRGWAP